MAEDEIIEAPILEEKDIVDEEEDSVEKIKEKMKKSKPSFDKESWKPKTKLGDLVKNGQITNIDEILDKGEQIREAEIVDILLPDLETDLLLIGQAKGKFGGGQRRVFKQTQKKTNEGNKPNFASMAVVGDKDGHFGVGYGKSRETVPAREKSIRNAKLSIMKIKRGCGSWQCNCKTPHSIPFKVTGKSGSVVMSLIPAPKGTGLCVEKECKKILSLAGIKDCWSTTEGHTKTKTNLIYACVKALEALTSTKTQPHHNQMLGIVEGSIRKDEVETQ